MLTNFPTCLTAAAVVAATGSGEACLELDELSHEVEVGRDERAPQLEVVVRLVQTQSTGVHQIGDADGRRATDASTTMDQHLTTGLTNTLCTVHAQTSPCYNVTSGVIPSHVRRITGWV